MSENNFVEIPVFPDSDSFANGPYNQYGLRMKFYRNDKLVFCNISVPEHMTRWNSFVHEGILSTMLDETMAWGAIIFLRKNVFTKSMTVNYHIPVMALDMLRIEGQIEKHTSEREAVIAGRIYNSRGELCVTSTGIFSLMAKDYVKKLAIADEREIEFYWDMMDSIDKI